MFAYVKNYASVLSDKNEVSGMLLYAKTNQGVQPDFEYHMSGNRISVKTLDGIEPYPRSPCFSNRVIISVPSTRGKLTDGGEEKLV